MNISELIKEKALLLFNNKESITLTEVELALDDLISAAQTPPPIADGAFFMKSIALCNLTFQVLIRPESNEIFLRTDRGMLALSAGEALGAALSIAITASNMLKNTLEDTKNNK